MDELLDVEGVDGVDLEIRLPRFRSSSRGQRINPTFEDMNIALKNLFVRPKAKYSWSSGVQSNLSHQSTRFNSMGRWQGSDEGRISLTGPVSRHSIGYDSMRFHHMEGSSLRMTTPHTVSQLQILRSDLLIPINYSR